MALKIIFISLTLAELCYGICYLRHIRAYQCSYLNEEIYGEFYDNIPKHGMDKLTIELSNFTEISAEMFEEIKGLNELQLNNNEIGSIQQGAFDNFTNLTRLSLSGNNLQNINGNIFKALHNLSALDLSKNEIIYINDIANLPKLKELYLSENQIEDMAQLKKWFGNLTILDLSGNKIAKIPEGVRLDKIQILNLTGNKIDNDDGVIGRILSLQELKICDNGIKDLNFLSNSTELLKLEVEGNKIENLDNLPKQLTLLNVANNKIKKFPILLKKLDTLDISYNKLNSISRYHLANLTALLVLNLSQNHLFQADLPANLFENNEHIYNLNLSRTGIRNVKTGTFWYLWKLQVLDLSWNRIRYVPNTLFYRNRALTELYLQGNEIKQISTPTPIFKNIKLGLFSQISNIKVLDLSYNKLRKFPIRLFSNLKSLKELYLRGNLFKSLNLVDFPNSIHRLTLTLDENPWNCDNLLIVKEFFWISTILPGKVYDKANLNGIECDDGDPLNRNVQNGTETGGDEKNTLQREQSKLWRTLIKTVEGFNERTSISNTTNILLKDLNRIQDGIRLQLYDIKNKRFH